MSKKKRKRPEKSRNGNTKTRGFKNIAITTSKNPLANQKKSIIPRTINDFEGGRIRSYKTNTEDSSGNLGLYFNKYVDTWRVEGQEIKIEKNTQGESEGWIEKILDYSRKVCKNTKALRDLIERNKALIEERNGTVLKMESTSRTLLGIGYDHPIENGFQFHHTLGVPFIRGTSLKGALKSFIREWTEDSNFDSNSDNEPPTIDPFIITDAIPDKCEMEAEIITPHYANYYGSEKMDVWPGDWESPTPIPFLALPQNLTFTFGIIPRNEDINIEFLVEKLEEALEIIGIGAKTSSGYGRFKLDKYG